MRKQSHREEIRGADALARVKQFANSPSGTSSAPLRTNAYALSRGAWLCVVVAAGFLTDGGELREHSVDAGFFDEGLFAEFFELQ
jgi:hypothetical protein